MAAVKPFRCIHPANGREEQIAALPYDVYSREEARNAVEGKPLSFLNIDRPETMFAPEQDMYAPEVYKAAASRLQQMRTEGSFVQEEMPVYYLYELTMDDRSQTGIVACASVDDYLNKVIKKHENTREEKEQDRIRHVDVCSAQTGPIFLAYRSNEVLRKLTARVKATEPEFAFVSEDGIGHRGWKISNQEEVQQIEQAFSKIDSIYIADGHHRAASAVKVGLKRRAEHPDYDGTEEFNYFLSVLFPDEELLIMDYNRVLMRGSASEFMEKFHQFTFDLNRDDVNLKAESLTVEMDRIKNHYELYTYASAEEVQAMLQAKGLEYSDFKPVKMTLEDAFIGLTGKY